jgi:hypothetical protein
MQIVAGHKAIIRVVNQVRIVRQRGPCLTVAAKTSRVQAAARKG